MQLLKKRTKRERTTRGVGSFFWGNEPAQSRQGTGIEPYVFIVRAEKLIICNGHLRWGQLPSAGPRQKEGAEMESKEGWTGLVGAEASHPFRDETAKRMGHPLSLCVVCRPGPRPSAVFQDLSRAARSSCSSSNFKFGVDRMDLVCLRELHRGFC